VVTLAVNRTGGLGVLDLPRVRYERTVAIGGDAALVLVYIVRTVLR